jgi:hypothetical protein
LESVRTREGPIDESYPSCSSVNHSHRLYGDAYLTDPAAYTDVGRPDLTGMGMDSSLPQEATYSWGCSFKDTPPGEGGREPVSAELARGNGTGQSGDR